MVGIELQMINPTFSFRYLKGRCHGDQFSSKITYSPCTYRSGISKRNGYRYSNVRTNSKNDASISCKNFVNFGPVTPEKTGLIFWTFCTTWQKTGIFSRISQDILDRFLQSFHHMKVLWVQMIDSCLFFRYVKVRCRGNQLILAKWHERRLIPLAFFALSLENELYYYCPYVRVNSGDDVATSCKNLVNFCLVTPEIMELINLKH